MNRKSFGKKLREYRTKLGLSLKECSEQIGISSRYLLEIERGYKLPKLEAFLLILNTLSASADDVLQDSIVVGCVAKSNYILSALESLDVAQKKQVLEIMEAIILKMKGL